MHPDKFGGESAEKQAESADQAARVTHAFTVLKQPNKR
jgi:DnaJ-domain-containing protein 1